MIKGRWSTFSNSQKNLLAYYANFGVVAALGLIANPILLGYLGSNIFGAWKSLQRFFDFASVADGRATQATKWIIASHHGQQNELGKRQAFGAGLIVWACWLPLTALVAAALIALVPRLASFADLPSGDLRLATVILAFYSILAGLLLLPDSFFVGVNLGYVSTFVITAAALVQTAAMCALAALGLNLTGQSASVLGAAVLTALATILLARQRIQGWGLSRPPRSVLKRSFSFGGWILGWSLTDKLLLSVELLVFAVIFGPSAVSSLVVSSFAFSFVVSISLVTASAFTPSIASLWPRAATEARILADRTRRRVYIVSGGLMLVVAGINETFISLWVGDQFFLGGWETGVLAIGLLAATLIRCESQLIDTTTNGRKKFLVAGPAAIGLGVVGVWVAWSGMGMLGTLAVLAAGKVLIWFMMIQLRYSQYSLPRQERRLGVAVIAVVSSTALLLVQVTWEIQVGVSLLILATTVFALNPRGKAKSARGEVR
ncbi:hypothetical protein GCM10027270_35050 [Nocardioides ginkgobilobae]